MSAVDTPNRPASPGVQVWDIAPARQASGRVGIGDGRVTVVVRGVAHRGLDGVGRFLYGGWWVFGFFLLVVGPVMAVPTTAGRACST